VLDRNDGKPDVVLGSIGVGDASLELYVDFDWDSAVLGFSLDDGSGARRYFPLYGSTYRGLPAVTIEVFVSPSQEEVWVRSSWPGYEQLGYHRVGTDRCITRYGEIEASPDATPAGISGATADIPPLDEAASKAAAFTYAGDEDEGDRRPLT
jgi:hypothetical protein